MFNKKYIDIILLKNKNKLIKMNLKLLNKFSNKNFNQKLNKKSSYLNHLSNQKIKSLKSLQSKKINILYDEITGYNKFQRDYSIFDHPIATNISNNSKNEESEIINEEKNLSKKAPMLLPYIKLVMASPNEKEYPERYKKKDFMIDKFSGMYLKPKCMSLHKIKQNKIDNNSYKQSNKLPKEINNSSFVLPLVNKSQYKSNRVKNNEPYFSSNNIML